MFELDKIYEIYRNKTDSFFQGKDIKDIKEKSQYFTPIEEAARLMEDLEISGSGVVRILDPCCGNGILLFKLLEKIIERSRPEKIYIDIYDIDNVLIENVKSMFESIKINKVSISIRYFNEDFLRSIIDKRYDYIVMNPPFKKINAKDVPSNMKSLVYGQPNLYHLFIKKALDLLEHNGKLCVISPKNYLSGRYTEGLRNYIVKNFSITKINTSNDRKNIFKNNITQEICMLHIVKSKKRDVVISYNDDKKFKVQIKDIISKGKSNIIFTPRNKKDFNLIKAFSKFPVGTLGNEIVVRVGKVVQFRVNGKGNNLVNEEFYNVENGIPLIVYRHIRHDTINYSKLIDKPKNNAITLIDDNTNESILIKNSNYILIRKNVDKKYDKLIHSVIYLQDLKSEKLAIDNGIMYFTNLNDTLTQYEILGMQCILKSKQFDDYYRMVNSTHTINVYELENLSFPSINTIREIGRKVKDKNISIDEATRILDEYL